MTIIDRIKKVVFKYKKVQIEKIYEELSDCNKDVIRGTINRYVKREDREFERAERGTYEVIEGKVDDVENLTDETLNSEIDMEEEIVMYHASMDIDKGEKVFIPRIPKYRCKEEDDTIKRISVAQTIEDAISGFPYKKILVNKCRGGLLTVYELKVKRKDVVFWQDLHYLVPDSHLTKECWIMKETPGIGKIVDIKNITLTGYDKYCEEYVGQVNNLIYRDTKIIEDCKMPLLVVDKENYKKLIEILSVDNLKYSISESGKNKFYKLNGYHYSAGTTEEEYEWWNFEIELNSGYDNEELWKLKGKLRNLMLEINAYHKPCGVDLLCDEDDEGDIDVEIDMYLFSILSTKKGEDYSNKIGKERYNELLKEVKSRFLLKENKADIYEAIEDIVDQIVDEEEIAVEVV